MKNKLNINFDNYSKTSKNKIKNVSAQHMLMIMGFVVFDKQNINISNIIVKCMNYMNSVSTETFVTNDFIVISIGRSIHPVNTSICEELYNSFNSINIKLFNIYKDTETVNTLPYFNYIITQSMHKVYTMFMDVFNDIIFETKKYNFDNTTNTTNITNE